MCSSYLKGCQFEDTVSYQMKCSISGQLDRWTGGEETLSTTLKGEKHGHCYLRCCWFLGQNII